MVCVNEVHINTVRASKWAAAVWHSGQVLSLLDTKRRPRWRGTNCTSVCLSITTVHCEKSRLSSRSVLVWSSWTRQGLGSQRLPAHASLASVSLSENVITRVNACGCQAVRRLAEDPFIRTTRVNRVGVSVHHLIRNNRMAISDCQKISKNEL